MYQPLRKKTLTFSVDDWTPMENERAAVEGEPEEERVEC